MKQPSIIKELITADGWCCPYAWTRDLNRRGISSEREAKRLGVSVSTLKRWRKQLVAGNLACDKWINCSETKQEKK
jgi:transposase-like protein